jgi:hypothetical protein
MASQGGLDEETREAAMASWVFYIPPVAETSLGYLRSMYGRVYT